MLDALLSFFAFRDRTPTGMPLSQPCARAQQRRAHARGVRAPLAGFPVWRPLRAFGDGRKTRETLACMTTARELTNRLAALLRNERNAMADFLLALADFDRRRTWSELGHTSLFSFLRRELGLSAGAAQYRKTAVEVIQKLPEVEAALRDGRLCLSTVIEVAKVLTPENVGDVLPRFFGLSRREAESVAVSIRPVESPPRRDVVTQVRSALPALPLRLSPDAPERTPSNPAG